MLNYIENLIIASLAKLLISAKLKELEFCNLLTYLQILHLSTIEIRCSCLNVYSAFISIGCSFAIKGVTFPNLYILTH